MEPEPIKKRLDALDGLRGIAILLVLLSHLNLTLLFDKGSNIVLKTIFDSGEIGVSILFILSGFLMAYLYPNPKSKLEFLQKRYTRIFPAFIAMCVLLSGISLYPRMIENIPQSLGLLFGIGIIFHLIWVYIIKNLSPKFGKVLFYLFLAAQIIIGAFYLLWVMRMDYSIYIETIPEYFRALITFLVNATLTLPLGTYSGPLSEVYWSLGTEVYFYILYPIIAVPFISLASKTNRITKIILIASTLPLFIGLYFISQKFLFFKLLHIELAYYFIGGLSLGYFYRHKVINFDLKSKKYSLISWLSIPLFLGTIVLYQLLLIHLPTATGPFIKTLFTLPISLTVLLILIEQTKIQKLLNTKALIHIGTISYSMYLIHMFIFDLAKKQLYEPNDLISLLLYITVTISCSILIASCIYYLLEKPYFTKKKSSELSVSNDKNKNVQNYSITKIVIVTSLIYFATTFFAYNSDFKLFSLQSKYSNENIITSNLNTKYISLNQNPKIDIQFSPKENNLAILQVDLEGTNKPNQEFIRQKIIARLNEKGTNKWQESELLVNSRDDTIKNLFGFSPIPDSKDKQYNLQIILDEPTSSHQVTINTSQQLFIAHYTLNKSDITNPTILIKLGLNKVQSIIQNPIAQIIFLLYLPFLLISIYLIRKK